MVVASRVVVEDSVVETDGGWVGTDRSGKGVGGETPVLGAAGEMLLVLPVALPSGEFSLG